MIVMREIQLRLAAKAYLQRASRRLAEWSHFRLSDPWLNCCLQANALSDQCLPNSKLVCEMRMCLPTQFHLAKSRLLVLLSHGLVAELPVPQFPTLLLAFCGGLPKRLSCELHSAVLRCSQVL